MSCLELLSFFSWKTEKNREQFLPRLRTEYLSVLSGLSWIFVFCFFLLLWNFVLMPDIFLFQVFFFFFVHQTHVKFGSRVPFILLRIICLFLELSASVFFSYQASILFFLHTRSSKSESLTLFKIIYSTNPSMTFSIFRKLKT